MFRNVNNDNVSNSIRYEAQKLFSSFIDSALLLCYLREVEISRGGAPAAAIKIAIFDHRNIIKMILIKTEINVSYNAHGLCVRTS